MTFRTTPTYSRIPIDLEKRYLVVGDLHGRFATLTDLLEKSKYAPERDILLSVGDLIDRGPHSVELINFFSEPDRYVVRGNHEQMVLNPDDWFEVWSYPPNGGPATSQSLQAANLDINWLQNKIIEYPVCLDIGDDEDPAAFRIVHAEQPFDWSESQFQNFLHTSTYLDAGEGRLLWGRGDIEAIADGLIPALHPQRSTRRCFCGHTPIDQIAAAYNTYWIDTFEADTLSCIDAVTLEEWSVPVRDNEYPQSMKF
ncbi:MAG: metallophosphoesterase [Granulosicoccus sp.]